MAKLPAFLGPRGAKATASKTIFGWDDNKEEEGRIADMALSLMAKLQKPTEAEKVVEEGVSDSKDVCGMSGQSKP